MQVSKSKRNRFIVVALVIVIVVIAAVAYLSAGTTATTMTVAQAADAAAHGKKVKVEGAVVDNSFTIDGDTLTFQIVDADTTQPRLTVVYDKGVSSTFGNGVTAICTGTIDSGGTLRASELITKCPSKYESSNEALSVSRLLSYGTGIVDKPVKITGTVAANSMGDVNSVTRFVLADAGDPASTVGVKFSGAIPDGVADGTKLVLTGSLGSDGRFTATDFALDSESKG